MEDPLAPINAVFIDSWGILYRTSRLIIKYLLSGEFSLIKWLRIEIRGIKIKVSRDRPRCPKGFRVG